MAVILSVLLQRLVVAVLSLLLERERVAILPLLLGRQRVAILFLLLKRQGVVILSLIKKGTGWSSFLLCFSSLVSALSLDRKTQGGSYPLPSSLEAEVDILFLLLERQGVASHPFERSKGRHPLPSSREAEGRHPLLDSGVAEGGQPLHSSRGQKGCLSSAGF